MQPTIQIAFRFHGNFYHSYRGDTPDELGFGKDVRVIRHLLRTLDELNEHGIPVCGTWDLENYFSLEQIMPAHCPDIIEGLQRRARAGQDEMQLMAYNNGLISAHTAREFEEAIRRAITNPAGSGLADLFGDRFYPMVRPQEMLFTPIHLKLYQRCGIHAISLFYSALPFNAFSTFVPPLAFAQRYNPLTLTYPGLTETMRLLPCYNTGDLADHLTLRRWVQGMRRQQLALTEPHDLLLLIDMDADDEFWIGYDIPLLRGRFSTAGGLRGLVENVADLNYVRFTTPGRYLQDHPPLGSLSIGQDTADGSFDGLSSWAEKWSNHRLWTGLERARILDLQARRLAGDEVPREVADLLATAFEARLKLLSTTHFGMAAPVMNLTREVVGRDLADQAMMASAAAFGRLAGKPGRGVFSLVDYVRGESTALITYRGRPSRSLVRLPLRAGAPATCAIRRPAGELIPSAMLQTGTGRELLFVDAFQPCERRDYAVAADQRTPALSKPVLVTADRMENEFLRLDFDQQGQLTGVQLDGQEFAAGSFLTSALTYGRATRRVEIWTVSRSLGLGVVGVKRMAGDIELARGHVARFEREILLAVGLPYLYVRLGVRYPRSPDRGYNQAKAQRLQQAWDNAWREVMPCEIRPALAGQPDAPLRVWKHNYCDHVSSYSLDYGAFSRNDTLDSANNHITHAWVAVSDGARGLLVAQSADVASGMAFCPLRTRREEGRLRVRLNPFGSYWGRQYRYPTADTGLGNLLATTFSASDHIKPYAPSYNGRLQEFSLLIAPYEGNAPPDAVRYDAEAFAYPYIVLNDDEFIAAPAHRGWDGAGVGEVP